MLNIKYPFEVPETLDGLLGHTPPAIQCRKRHAVANKANMAWNGIQYNPESWVELLIQRSDEQFFVIFSEGEEKDRIYNQLPSSMYREKVEDATVAFGHYEFDINSMNCLFNYTPQTYHMILCGVSGKTHTDKPGIPKMSLGQAMVTALKVQGFPNTLLNANGDLLYDGNLLGKIVILHIDGLKYQEIYLIEEYVQEYFNSFLLSEHLLTQSCLGMSETNRNLGGFTGIRNILPEFDRDRFWWDMLNLIVHGAA